MKPYPAAGDVGSKKSAGARSTLGQAKPLPPIRVAPSNFFDTKGSGPLCGYRGTSLARTPPPLRTTIGSQA